MSVSAHMLVNDVDRHEGFDMVKMNVTGPDGLDGTLEFSVTDSDLVGSFQPGAEYELSLTAAAAEESSSADTVTDDDVSSDAADTDTDVASGDDTSDAA